MKLLNLDPSKSLSRSSRDLLVQLLQVQVPYNQIHLRAGHRIQHKHWQILRKGVLLTCVSFMLDQHLYFWQAAWLISIDSLECVLSLACPGDPHKEHIAHRACTGTHSPVLINALHHSWVATVEVVGHDTNRRVWSPYGHGSSKNSECFAALPVQVLHRHAHCLRRVPCWPSDSLGSASQLGTCAALAKSFTSTCRAWKAYTWQLKSHDLWILMISYMQKNMLKRINS
jgi:hypothetical protein